MAYVTEFGKGTAPANAPLDRNGNHSTGTDRPQQFDTAELRRAVVLLFDAEHAVELRAVKPWPCSIICEGSD